MLGTWSVSDGVPAGTESRISHFSGFMPLIFYSAVSVLGCDGEKCEVTADEIGYDTPGQHLGTVYLHFELLLCSSRFL